MSRKKLELDAETIATLSARGTDYSSLGVFGLQRHATGNPRSTLVRDKVKAYKRPRIINGLVVCSYKTSTEKSSGHVSFSDEDYEPPVKHGDPETCLETMGSEVWDSKRQRVNMHGNRGERFDSRGSRSVRVSRKSQKTVEIIRNK